MHRPLRNAEDLGNEEPVPEGVESLNGISGDSGGVFLLESGRNMFFLSLEHVLYILIRYISR